MLERGAGIFLVLALFLFQDGPRQTLGAPSHARDTPMLALPPVVLRDMPSLRSTLMAFQNRLEVLEQLKEATAQQQDGKWVAQLEEYIAVTHHQMRMLVDNLDRIFSSD
jgi:hypothetical protein